MTPNIFKKVKKKLLYLDEFRLALEVIDIIKSFAFYDVNTKPYYKIIKKEHFKYLNQCLQSTVNNGEEINHFWKIRNNIGIKALIPNFITKKEYKNKILFQDISNLNIKKNVEKYWHHYKSEMQFISNVPNDELQTYFDERWV